MKRYAVSAAMSLQVEADSVEEAWAEIGGALMGSSVVSWEAHHSSESEVVYNGLPSRGADRWAQAAASCWLDHDDRETRKQMGGVYDGSWWWTNGHVALRCEGTIPEDFRCIPEADFVKAIASQERRRETSWSRELTDTSSSPLAQGHRAVASPDVVVQAQYRRLIDDSVPGAKWFVGDQYTIPLHVHDIEGRLIAVVMPMRSESFPPIPAPCASEGQEGK